MRPTNNIGNSQWQEVQSRMASCLVRTFLGFICSLHSFSLKGFIFITAGERSVTCGKKVMRPTNISSNTQQQDVQSRMASCLVRMKTAPKSPKGDLQDVLTRNIISK